ncbi:GMC oxidoreductase [Peniophora sp. CONT]|nr:GMC oxidoreductase [Peniophora sp. CONT]
MSLIRLASLVPLFCVLPWHALATVHNTVSGLNRESWDIIIIGGGTAGSVLARRLSEDTSVSVLLVEAGGDNNGPLASEIQVPFFASKAEMTGSAFDWNYTTVPQGELSNRTLPYARGFVLGGCSSTNGLAYTRGATDDYDRLANVSGDEGWSWNSMVPYFLQSEQHVASADGHNTTGQFDPAWHGDGPVLTSLPGSPSTIDDMVIATTQELSSEFPFDEEMNDGHPVGIGWLQSTIGHSMRSSSATAYLSPDVRARSNLDILVSTRTTRLIQTAVSSDGLPEFKAVEVATNSTASRAILRAHREVILAAGAVGTPHLLMLSGIGNVAALSTLGINTTVDSPQVGKALHDQPLLFFQWLVNTTNTNDNIARNETLSADLLAQYESNGTGLFANNGFANHLGFFRLPNDSSILAEYGEIAAGPDAPHFEMSFTNGYVSTSRAAPTTGNFVSGAVVLVAPTSRGSVVLNSSSPFDAPLINPGFLSTDADVATIIAAVQTLHKFFSADAWKNYIIAPAEGSPNYSNEQSIVTYVRENAVSVNHPVATARIIDVETGEGVVHANLTVRGAKGIRVVDASVLPYVPAGHPQAVVYALAERAVGLIKESW